MQSFDSGSEKRPKELKYSSCLDQHSMENNHLCTALRFCTGGLEVLLNGSRIIPRPERLTEFLNWILFDDFNFLLSFFFLITNNYNALLSTEKQKPKQHKRKQKGNQHFILRKRSIFSLVSGGWHSFH